MSNPESGSATPPPRAISFWTWTALLVALVTLVGSLLLSVALNLKACPLCFYQRTFVMGVVGILVVGLGARGLRPGLLSFLALALAVGGLGVAGFHVNLELTGKLECPPGVLGLGTAPQQSLAAFILLVLALLIDVVLSARDLGGRMAVLAPVILGAAFTVAAIKSSSPPCPPDYSKPLDGCRPPRIAWPDPNP